jgi:hypothetical protein
MSVDDQPLAKAQADLVASLTGRNTPPRDFDASRLTATAVILVDKRRRAIAKRFPILPRLLGESFASRFDDYARATAAAATTDEDALQFMTVLGTAGVMPRGLRSLRMRLRLRMFMRRRSDR